MESRLRKRLKEVMNGENEKDWENPFDWSWDHDAVVSDASASGFDLGVDEEGDILINHDGYCKCVHWEHVVDALERSMEVREDEA